MQFCRGSLRRQKQKTVYVIQDYNKPMGVATYKTLEDMPEKLRKALPDIKEMQKLLEGDIKE